jgi:hypothetical protein
VSGETVGFLDFLDLYIAPFGRFRKRKGASGDFLEREGASGETVGFPDFPDFPDFLEIILAYYICQLVVKKDLIDILLKLEIVYQKVKYQKKRYQ